MPHRFKLSTIGLLTALALTAVCLPAAGNMEAPAAPVSPGSVPPASTASNGIVPKDVEPFEESIEVNVVNLDVVVRDRSGNLLRIA